MTEQAEQPGLVKFPPTMREIARLEDGLRDVSVISLPGDSDPVRRDIAKRVLGEKLREYSRRIKGHFERGDSVNASPEDDAEALDSLVDSFYKLAITVRVLNGEDVDVLALRDEMVNLGKLYDHEAFTNAVGVISFYAEGNEAA